MEIKMVAYKLEIGLVISCFISTLADEFILKVLFTTSSMVISVTCSFFWERYLKDKFKK